MAPLLRRAPAHSSGKARVCRRSASTGRSMGLAIIRVRSERTLLCRCKCATKLCASCPRHIGGRRQSTWRPKTPRRRRRSLHSAIEIACRGHRKLLELMAIRPRREWVEQRVAAQERGLRSIADATSCRPGPHGPVRSGGERRNMRRYGTPSRKNAPFPPASIAGHTRPRFAAGRSMLRISTRPLPYRSRVGTGC
jgi:hypothetical protein